jgi:hypothetical protein
MIAALLPDCVPIVSDRNAPFISHAIALVVDSASAQSENV